MFFLGSTQLSLTKDTGNFYCPHCDGLRDYKHKVVRQFLTVYFIPLIPLQAMKEFAECIECKNQYEISTLKYDKSSYEEERHRQAMEVIRNAIVLIVAADQTVTEEELAVVRDFGLHYLHTDFSAEQILKEASKFHQFEVDAFEWISRVGKQLTEEEKELLVHHAFLAAAATGDLSRARQGLLGQLPEAIDMPESLFRQVVSRAADS